jgi:glycosyltransferase involved in cell wall biosynthesis
MRTFRFATRLRRVDYSGYDVLHAHGDDYWLWRRRVGRHVRTLHGSCFEEALTIRGAKEKLRMVALGMTEVLASIVADTTVVVSPRTRRWTPWVHEVIPNGVDPGRFHPGADRASHPVILFVGTWHGRKRGALLAEAFEREVRPVLPDAELWMVTQDAPADVPDGVQVLGRLDDDALAQTYRRAWVFCLPSTYEGFGIPYAEAMLSGLPVVATPNPGSDFVTDGGRAGVEVPDDELGAALSRLLQDDTERERLRDAGLDRAAAFDIRAVADRYEALYRSDPRPR